MGSWFRRLARFAHRRLFKARPRPDVNGNPAQLTGTSHSSNVHLILPTSAGASLAQAIPGFLASLREMPRENIADTTAATFAELLSGPLLDIYVGPEGRKWTLPRNLLSYHSPFFDETHVVNGEHRRIKDGQLDLRDEDPGAFQLLVKWVYQGKIDDVSWIPKDVKWDYAFTCQKLYLLCDTLELLDLKNLAIDQFRKGCHEAGLVPGPEEMKPIYQKTPPDSPFRRLVSKIAARQIMDPDSDKDASSYKECFAASPDFAVDVINAIKQSSGGSLFDDPTEGNSCRFHEHQAGESCQKTVKFKDP